MSLRKVFNVSVDYGHAPPQVWHSVNAGVEADIRQLARQQGVTIAFHKAANADELGGAPPVLVEMPQSLAAQVEKIQGVIGVEENRLYKTAPRGF